MRVLSRAPEALPLDRQRLGLGRCERHPEQKTAATTNASEDVLSFTLPTKTKDPDPTIPVACGSAKKIANDELGFWKYFFMRFEASNSS